MDAREISDRLEIEDLLHAYVEALDARAWDAFRDLFTPDAVVDYTSSGGPRGPVDRAISWIDKGLSGFEITQHMITNQRIIVDGDEARARCSLINPMTSGEKVFLVGGRYDDRLRRTAEGWRFAERVQVGLWMSHMPMTPGWPPG